MLQVKEVELVGQRVVCYSVKEVEAVELVMTLFA